MESIRRSARDTKEEFLLYQSFTPKDNAKNYFLEIMQQIKYSLSRNISKNEKNTPLLTVIWLN